MSRIRTIKPEFWTSAQVVECSPNARLMFIGMWNFCDDLGRHSYSPKQIKMEVFAGDNFSSENIQGMLDELIANGLLTSYTVDDKPILQVTGWHHQKIDHPQKPKLPGPFDDNSENVRRTLAPESSLPEGKGKEGSRVESARPRASRPNSTHKDFQSIAENETPNEQQIADAERFGINTPEAVEAEFEHFRDYNLATGKALADWNAAWRNWLAKTGEFKPKPQVSRSNGHATGPPPRAAVANAEKPTQIFIEAGTPQWNAWDQFWRKSRQVGPPKTESSTPRGRKEGWWFPTEYPTSDG